METGASVFEKGVAGVNEEDNEVMKTEAVDPLAEADVYLAYDRDEQAVQVLKEAYADTPGRGELAEKLLEIYHKQDDRRAFDALAAELHRRIDTTRNLNWEKVVSMGREVSPENGLFAGDAPAASGPSDGTLDLEDDLLDDTPSGQINLDEGGLNHAALDSEEDNVGNLEVEGMDLRDTDSTLAKGEKNSEMIVLDLGRPQFDVRKLSQLLNQADDRKDAEEELYTMGVQQEDEISLTDGEVSLDLGGEDHEFDQTEAESNCTIADKNDGARDDKTIDAGVSLDEDSSLSELSEITLGKSDPYHEPENSLALAEAYIELGEYDIATDFIEEAFEKGSDKQKQKARDLMTVLLCQTKGKAVIR